MGDKIIKYLAEQIGDLSTQVAFLKALNDEKDLEIQQLKEAQDGERNEATE